MRARRLILSIGVSVSLMGGVSAFSRKAAPKNPRPTPGRTTVLPHELVAGAPATLAVLDAQGRLASGVALQFTLGLGSEVIQRANTDRTGRAVFIAPATPGVLFAQIVGGHERVSSVVAPGAQAPATELRATSYPEAASITDCFEISGKGFRGEADGNEVTIGGAPGLVLAASPVALVVFADPAVPAGATEFQVESSGRKSPPYPITLVSLELEAASKRLDPGHRQTLTVRARGTDKRLVIEAHNLSSGVATISGGDPLRLETSGGERNIGRFEIVGRHPGDFLIKIRLVPRQQKVEQ